MSTSQSEAMPVSSSGDAKSRTRRTVEIAVCVSLPLVVFSFSTLVYPAFVPLKDALLLAFGGALFAIALAAGWLSRIPRMWAALVTLYCASILAAWAGSYRRDMGTDAAFGLIAAPLFACATVAVVRRRMLLIEVIAGTGAIEAAIVLGQWLARWDPHQVFYRAQEVIGYIYSMPIVRPIGTIGTADVAALVIAASFPATLTLAGDRSRCRLPRALWLAVALADLAAIAGTACRASLVGALAGGIVVALPRLEHLRRRTVLTILAVVFLLAAAFGAAKIANRRNHLNLEMATSARTFGWRVAMAHWPGTMLLGSGPGTFRFNYMRIEGEWLREHNFEDIRYAGGNHDAQNDFLQARLDTGWFGLAALVAVLAWWTRVAISISRSGDAEQRAVATAALGGVAALLLIAIVETCFEYAESRMLLWLWMALPLTYAATSQKPLRFVPVRWVAAMIVFALFAWDASRIVESRFMTERGFREEFSGELAAAVADDRRAVEADPANREARFHLGRTQWKAGDIPGALRTLDDAVRWDSHPRVYEMRIRVLYRSGRLPEALRRAAEAARMFPWAPELQGWYKAAAARMTEAPRAKQP